MDMHKDSPQVCRLEVIDTGRRRGWTVEEKRRIGEESFRGHRQASATARRYRIVNVLPFNWRRLCRNGGLGDADEPGLLPAVPLVISGADDRSQKQDRFLFNKLGGEIILRELSLIRKTGEQEGPTRRLL